MKIVKVGVLAPTNKGIPLGVQGENRATQVEFDTRPWFREYPSGTVSAVARRYGDPAPYPLTIDVNDGTAVWNVSDTDTAKAGEGAAELTMTSAGTRVRSLTFKTLVTASLTDAPVDDDAWYGWLDKAVVKVDETVQSAQRKMAEVDDEWTGLKADVTAKVDECGDVAKQAAQDAHHAKVDAQATAKALESAEGSFAKAEAAANRAVKAALAADDSAVEASRSALSAGDSAEAARLSADAAANSAGDAATSASNAADAASAASGSASAAAQSATDANNAKAAAQTAKDEAASSASNAATSASNAASSATAAAKSASDAAASVGEMLNEAKKYTDANTSNALVDTVSGELLHVDDAWPGKPLSLTIDGAYKQDGTPSPDNPVPIMVIENPVVKVTGMNMFDISKLQTNFNDPYGLKISVEDGYIIIQGTVSGVENNTTSFLIGWYADNSISGKGLSISLFGAPSNVKAYGLRTADETQIAVSTSLMNGDKVDWKMKIVVSKGEPKEYKPYTSASLPITLPAEHPYLAALPDGTHDEIVIDKDGNASLVARTGKYQATGGETLFFVGVNEEFYIINTPIVSGNGYSPEFPYVKSTRHTFGFSTSDQGEIYMSNPGVVTDYDSAVAWLKAHTPTFYGHIAKSITYPLGKLDIPALPETISNVWTDAELTTNMSMTYKRDINIAFENLTQAVVAAAAGD